MTDQNEREWPSFGDILEELNSLGGLTQPTRPAPPEGETPSVPTDAPTSVPDADPAPPFDTSELPFQTDPLETGETEVDEAVTSKMLEGIQAAGSGPGAIDWSSWDFAGPDSTDEPLSQTFAPPTSTSTEDDAAQSAVIFEFDTSLLEADPDPDPDPESSIDDGRFDSVATANEIETDLHELFSFVEVDDSADDMDQDSQIEAPADATELAELVPQEEPSTDDSTAADAESVEHAPIEESDPERSGTEPDLTNERDDDNVVPLHRDTDNSEHVMGLDDLFDPAKPQPVQDRAAAAEFVSVAEDTARADDSWDYLRPDEEELDKSGLWSRRPKLFGGDERKAKRAERRKAEEEAELHGPPCPKCGAAGHVDLDDPIGGKIHCSCRSCDHVWSELSRSAQESA